MNVWILTVEHNDYDQHGAYFVEVYKSIPTIERLRIAGVPENRLTHVQAGGGRVGVEDHWFTLHEIEPK